VTWGTEFERAYQAKFGSSPYTVIDRASDFDIAAANTSEIAIGWAQRLEFQQWYREHFLPSNDMTCSDTIVVFPFNGNGGVPWYRDMLTTDSEDGVVSAPDGYVSWNLLSVLNGSPEIAVPVESVSYTSRVRLVEEYYPASLEIQAAYGCDFMLMNSVREVAISTDFPTGVKTGRFVY
jgi:hypothetical protein